MAREVRPAFYDRFACIASDCRHSCCRGWEIDVDDDTCAFYEQLEGPLGDELRDALHEEDGVWSFRLTAEENCPFLQRDGLCRLICALGEDALCDICALHPRFFEDVGETELSGVGLCCEAAASLLLEAPLTFLDEDDNAMTFPALLDELGIDLPLRYEMLGDWGSLFRRYRACEPIDEGWRPLLDRLERTFDADRVRAYAALLDRELIDRIYQYILYRQLEKLPDAGADTLIRYAREAVDLILLWASIDGDLPEAVRAWSAQTEYCDDNVALLLNE